MLYVGEGQLHVCVGRGRDYCTHALNNFEVAKRPLELQSLVECQIHPSQAPSNHLTFN